MTWHYAEFFDGDQNWRDGACTKPAHERAVSL